MQAAVENQEGAALRFLIPETPCGAIFSDDRIYRYVLWRRWTIGSLVAFVGLNPSTADEMADDPTIRRCIGFAKLWGFDGIVMLNIFAFRATDPVDMKRSGRPVGPENDEAIKQVQQQVGAVVCCWGTHGAFMDRGERVRDSLRIWRRENLFHLGLTSGGHPKHPLYLRADTERIQW